MAERILLVGNPNVGKSSLFNILTGFNQKTGNYDGVTVEKKAGQFKNFQIIDLPGLSSMWSERLDERISIDQILSLNEETDRIVFIADGLKLQHNLILFSQLADLQVPISLVINFEDELENKGVRIDNRKLQNKLGCPVITLNARSGKGTDKIKEIILNDEFRLPNAFLRTKYDNFDGVEIINNYSAVIRQYHDSDVLEEQVTIEDLERRNDQLTHFLHDIVTETITKKDKELTEKLDSVFLNPFWGTLIFIAVLFLVFQALFTFSAYPMEWIDQFFSWSSTLVFENVQPNWLADLIGNGLLPGLGGIIIFIPQIAILFILLGILESTGYLSRISYLADRWLNKFGLSGSSVIPLMSGIACAIPAIMSAKRIESESERIAAIFVAPFMTCSARLPVYVILIALIFPEDNFFWIFNVKGLVLLALYLLGTFTSLIAAWVINRFNKTDKSSIWMMELPRYRLPHWKNIFLSTWLKTKSFIVEAGKIILIISLVLWALSTNSPKSEAFLQEQIQLASKNNGVADEASIRLEYSYAGYAGKFIEPVIKPLGYDWKIGIALISSFAAREVFVGTISTIYSIGTEEESTIIERLRAEKNVEENKSRYDLATCISLLLFYAFAMQCMSTLAVVRKETGGWKWPIIQFIAMMILAYVSSFAAYQLLS